MVEEIIRSLNLTKHPEGGYYREIYRSNEFIPVEVLENRKNAKKPYRNISTSIYYLLVSSDVSLFHRIKSDEIWHFYQGSPLLLHILDEEKQEYRNITLGKDLVFQVVVPKNVWFSAEILDKSSYSLIGCTVSPGFEFEDFEIAKSQDLISKFPQWENLIKKFTKE
jgi:predicted cupin superfamily sugar epimerase